MQNNIPIQNIFKNLPKEFTEEYFETILESKSDSKKVKIERIVSLGHISPQKGWYDQAENEWVIVLQGCGKILFDDGEEVILQKGDYLFIPARKKHKVTYTDPQEKTIWLAFFYK